MRRCGKREIPEKTRRPVGIVRYHSNVLKSGSSPAGNRAQFSRVGGDLGVDHKQGLRKVVSSGGWIIKGLEGDSWKGKVTAAGERSHLAGHADIGWQLRPLAWNAARSQGRLPRSTCTSRGQATWASLTPLAHTYIEPRVFREFIPRRDCSAPTMTNRVQSPAGCLQIFFCKWESLRDDAAPRRVGSGISHFPRPLIPLLRTHLASPHVGSQDLAVKSRPPTYGTHTLAWDGSIADGVDRSRYLRTTNLRVPTLNCFSANTGEGLVTCASCEMGAVRRDAPPDGSAGQRRSLCDGYGNIGLVPHFNGRPLHSRSRDVVRGASTPRVKAVSHFVERVLSRSLLTSQRVLSAVPTPWRERESESERRCTLGAHSRILSGSHVVFKTVKHSLTLLLPAYYWLTVKRGVSRELSSNHNSREKNKRLESTSPPDEFAIYSWLYLLH
ncbi:hypothetical protein PR048_030067 [Dryococelus australis]|uniref:Uncharacterized protein n=1 Tax=Dryococelus australis TaxID=614101 RepID=A0ABQ9G7W5_9NEOP|nr:hypothetical protein PR048_030067 [Dryococelus australis]